MSTAHHAQPAVLRACDAIDEQFLLQVGPFGQFLAEETREQWLATGNKINATHVFEYLNLLARQIPDGPKRKAFLDAAMASVKR